MERTYAAELDDDNVVIRVIVGTAGWATDMLGGVWVDCDPCGPGWTWDGEQMQPPESVGDSSDFFEGEVEYEFGEGGVPDREADVT